MITTAAIVVGVGMAIGTLLLLAYVVLMLIRREREDIDRVSLSWRDSHEREEGRHDA